METKQKINNTNDDPCMWCCFPCIFLILSIEKCLQSSCLCCCQILACECKTTANEKINNIKNDKEIDMESNIDNKSIEEEFIEIVPRINRLSAKATNANFILYLIIQQLPNMKDDDKKLLINSIKEYKFNSDYEFSFAGKSEYVKYRNSEDINWIASTNQQTLDIAENWCKYDRESGIEGLIERYKQDQ